MLVYTLPELAKEFRTSKDKIYLLEELGEIRSMKLGSKKVSIYEAERFLKENAGRDFDQVIEDALKHKKLKEMDRGFAELKEA